MKRKATISAVVISSILLVFSAWADNVTWKQVGNKNGIKFEAGTVAGQKLQQFRGSGVINAPIEVIGEVIRDVPAYKDWMYACKENKLLKDKGNDNLICYYVHDSPFPVADRDVVVETHVKIDTDTGVNTITMDSIKYPYTGEKGRVRMDNLNAKFILTYMERNKTKVDFWLRPAHVPEVPDRLFNNVMKVHPYETIMGLREMVKKPKYAELGKTSKYFAPAEIFFQKKGK